jgi:hypothetical protein
MTKGTTYIVRPFIELRNRPVSLPLASCGLIQLFVGPASSFSREQMKVRCSVRATSVAWERW